MIILEQLYRLLKNAIFGSMYPQMKLIAVRTADGGKYDDNTRL